MKTFLFLPLISLISCKTHKITTTQELKEDFSKKDINKLDDLRELRTNVIKESNSVSKGQNRVSKKQEIDPYTVIDDSQEINTLVEQETSNRVYSNDKIPYWQVLLKCGTNRNKKLAELATQWVYNNRDKFYEDELNLQRKFENGGYIIIIKEFTDELEAKLFQYKVSRIPQNPRVYLSRRVVYQDLDSYKQSFF